MSKKQKWWELTRENLETKEMLKGIGYAIGYAVAVILVVLVVTIAAFYFTPYIAEASEHEDEITRTVTNAELYSSSEILDRSDELDGRTLIYEGETIGEALERGDNAWVNVSDGRNALGLWMSADEVSKITRYGDYRNDGDIIRATGVFRRSCSEHGGELDIHVSSIEILRVGEERSYSVSSSKGIFAVVTLVFLGGAVMLNRRYSKKSSKKYIKRRR